MAGIHTPSPIDTERMASFREDLTKQLAKGNETFRILESKLIDQRPDRKAILVFTELKIGEDELMQMHVLTSGESNQAIVTTQT